jgi:2-polyprenyl-3-methyl-5-hydroxy-6-metoxy-1,4-benzoquinol methylase
VVLGAAFLTLLLPLGPRALGAEISPTLKAKLAAQFNAERLAHLFIPQMLDVMDIDKAKAVLEVGAGGGVLTLPMAAELKGKGTLVATDTDKELVDYLSAQANEKGLTNLSVELIGDKAPAFKKETFDRIVMLSVFEYLKDQTAFLKALLPSLQKGGKVFIIHPKLYPAISPLRRLDLGFLASKLKLEGEKSPLAPYLSKESLAFINEGDKADLKSKAMVDLTKELNAIMQNPLFVKAFVASKFPVTPAALKGTEGKDLEALKKKLKGKLEGSLAKLTAEDKVALRTLGWLALKGRYIAPSGAMVGYDFTGPVVDSRAQVLAKAKKAGLVLETESELLPYYHFLVFTVK